MTARAPIGLMNAWLLQQVQLTPEERKDLMFEVGHAVVSEAQVDSPYRKGFLAESHDVFDHNEDGATIGASIEYAAAVHARHPTKAGWFMDAVRNNYPRIVRRLLIERLRSKGAN